MVVAVEFWNRCNDVSRRSISGTELSFKPIVSGSPLLFKCSSGIHPPSSGYVSDVSDGEDLVVVSLYVCILAKGRHFPWTTTMLAGIDREEGERATQMKSSLEVSWGENEYDWNMVRRL